MIFRMVIAFILLEFTSCQYQMSYPDLNTPTEASVVKNVYRAAPLHYVKIGPKLAGDYKFGYDTGKGPLGQSYREEIRLADGTISGTYGVVDELGHKRIVHYSAGKSGLISQENTNSKIIEEPISSTPMHEPRYVENPNLNVIPPQYTSPLMSFRLANFLQAKSSIPVYREAKAMQRNAIATTLSQIYGVPAPAQHDETTQSLIESSKVANQQRLAKSDSSLAKSQRMQDKDITNDAQTYDPKIEDEYYDSAPAFIDFERLSYNIGSDKNISVTF